MEAKNTEWRPGPSVCRCCLTEGCYKDISTEYFWMGKREVYAEMLSDTLNVTIAYSQAGGPNSNSRLICEPCISRLRDACDFKRQVLECEKTFMQQLEPSSSSIEPVIETEVPLEILDVKLEQVKFEKELSDDDYNDDRDFDAGDDDDDMDDEPLTKLASRLPKKESVDLMDLLDNTKAAEKRKSTTKTKVNTKKPKIMNIDMKPSPSKTTPKPEKKKKEEHYDAARANAETIISCTTAYPFRVNTRAILCVYCQELYDDADVFREHMDKEHDYYSIKVAFHHLPRREFIKADLTNLKCRICQESLDTLELAADHIHTVHGKTIDYNGKLGVMPYYLKKDAFNCAVCEKNFPSLLHLNRHTITHFLAYVCDVCGNSYVATTGLLKHMRSKHEVYEVPCKRCNNVFPTMEAKEKHIRTEKSCMPYCCPKCLERFVDWRCRKRHMEEAHGETKKPFKCAKCNLEFANETPYYDHYKRHHSDDCILCKFCGAKFLSIVRLRKHMEKHAHES